MITTTKNKISYVSDGTTTTYDFDFPAIEPEDIQVFVYDLNNNKTQLVYGTDYTVSLNNDNSGGTITLTNPANKDYTILIYREVPYTQETVYEENSPFPAKSHEKALDKLTLLSQQLQEKFDRTLQYDPIDEDQAVTLPPLVGGGFLGTTADKKLTWKANVDYSNINLKVNTIKDLLNIDLTNWDGVQPFVVLVLGYHEPNDGGGGVFYWDANEDKVNHNGGTIIDPEKAFPSDWDNTSQQDEWFNVSNSGNGCWKRIYNEAVYVNWFGAKGDGITDDTKPIQKAIDTNDYIILVKTYFAQNIRVSSNKIIDGLNTGQVINNNGDAVFIINPSTQNTQYENIEIKNLTFYGQSDTLGFSQFVHLLHIDGAKNVKVHNCEFRGFRGDGIYIGSGLNADEEYHNEEIYIYNCIFDGINNANRNGISVIDGNKIHIYNNIFKNTTESDMPGAIDIEPNDNYNVIANIYIHDNIFRNITGNAGIVSVVLGQYPYTIQPYNINIYNNDIDNNGKMAAFIYKLSKTGGIDDTDPYIGYNIYNNTVKNTFQSFGIYNLKGGNIYSNRFENILYHADIGWSDGNTNIIDVNIHDNVFVKCGTESTQYSVLVIFKSSKVKIYNNTFRNFGNGTNGTGIEFNAGTSSDIYINNNVFLQDNGYPGNSIINAGNHTFTPATNMFIGNTIVGSNAFESYINDYGYNLYDPIVIGSSTAGTGTYNTQFGMFYKIGKKVFFQIYLDVASHTGTGMIQITLPSLMADMGGGPYQLVNLAIVGAAYTGDLTGLINPYLHLTGSDGSTVGGIRAYYTKTDGTQGQLTIPSGEFKIWASGWYQEA